MPLACLEVGHFHLNVFILHEREQAVLGNNPLHIGLAADHRADLVHLIHTDDAMRDIVAHGFEVGLLTQNIGRLARQPVHDDIALCPPARQVRHQIGVDADDGGELLVTYCIREELFRRPHDGGLAGTGISDQHDISHRMFDEVLVNGDGHVPERRVLPDNVAGQGGVDFLGCH